MDRNLLRLITSQLDNATLQSISQTPLWSQVKKTVDDQHYWKLRVENLVGRELRPRPGADWKTAYYILDPAIERDELVPFSPEVIADKLSVEVLLESGYDPSAEDNYAIKVASWGGYTEVVKLLLQDKRVDPTAEDNYAIKTSTTEKHIEVVRLLLADPRIDPAVNNDELLRLAIGRSDGNIIELLLEDPRVDKSGEVAAEELNRIRGQYPWDSASRLLRSRNLDFQKLSSATLMGISGWHSQIGWSTEGAIYLSNESETYDSIRDKLSRVYASFNESHYNMLLREIIFKRRDLNYYLDWLQKMSSKGDTSYEVKRLLAAAKNSTLSREPVVHISDFFTAYRGFFLLSTSENPLNMLDDIAQEGVTQEGLDMASVLVGAFLGMMKIRELEA